MRWLAVLVALVVVVVVVAAEQRHDKRSETLSNANGSHAVLLEEMHTLPLACHERGTAEACLGVEKGACQWDKEEGKCRESVGSLSLSFLEKSSCMDKTTCQDCYASSALCHWCAADAACHMRGSFHGCTWGESCNKTAVPTVAPTVTMAPTAVVPTAAPQLKHCLQHKSCEDCTRTDYCHWCARDKACHVMGSVFGCWYGVNCNSNERCQRPAPQELAEVGLTEPEEIFGGVVWERQLVAMIASVAATAVALLLVLLALFLWLVVRGAAAAAAVCPFNGGSRTQEEAAAFRPEEEGEGEEEDGGNGREASETDDAADIVNSDSLSQPLLEQQPQQRPKPNSSWWSFMLPSSSSATSPTSTPNATTGEDCSPPSSRKETLGATQGNDDEEDRQLLPTAAASALDETSSLLPIATATMDTGDGSLSNNDHGGDDDDDDGHARAASFAPPEVPHADAREPEQHDDLQERQAKRRRCCCYCCSCSSIILAVSALSGVAVAWLCFYLYPIWPQYSVCSDAVAWKSILEAMKQGHEKASFDILASVANPNVYTAEVTHVSGLLTHNSTATPPVTDVVGSFTLVTNQSSTVVAAKSITDVLVKVTVSPARTRDLWNLMEEFYKGTLVLGLAETHATVRVPRWQYWIDVAGRYIPPATPWVEWLQDLSYDGTLIPVNRTDLYDRHLCACPEW